LFLEKTTVDLSLLWRKLEELIGEIKKRQALKAKVELMLE